MPQIQFERIWIAQCLAGWRVKSHFGLSNASDRPGLTIGCRSLAYDSF